jgi:hypothetical protein
MNIKELKMKIDLSRVASRYKFSILFALLIIFATTLHWILLASQIDQCHASGWIKVYVRITAPFNIGCEGNPPANFAWPIFCSFLVEYFTGNQNEKYRKNIFLAAFLATYLLQFITLSAGTSIVAASMFIFLVYWFEKHAWEFMHTQKCSLLCKIKVSLVSLTTLILSSYLAYNLYSEHLPLHVLGVVFFIILEAYFIFDPDGPDRLVRLTIRKK